ncbi:ParM/StbA family protein [Listeria sp. ILCC797]|uniref:ParM/StbA family protein n=1 Tax=Listeria sp. ILCC797 TaxID=1918333 RepID=UPI000B5915F1|nr:ParM/StbA family protein [Listeria sp. ILCC797]
MREIFAIDLGNKQVKLKSSRGEYRFPSRLLLERKSGLDLATEALKVNSGIDTFQMLNEKDSFKIGEGIDKLGKNSDMRETIAFGKSRYTNAFFEKLIEYSLAKLSLDFEGETPEVEVVIGVPTEDFTKDEIKKTIVRYLNPEKKKARQHSAIINDQTINTFVVRTHLLPQPMGTIYDLVLDDAADIRNKDMITQNIALVDIGGGTVLLDSINHFEFDTINRKQEKSGVHKLLGSINSDYDGDIKPDIYEIEGIIRDGKEAEEFIYSPTVNESISMTEVIQYNIDRYTEEIIQKVVSVYKDMDQFDVVIFTGGGSSIINKELIHNSLDHVLFSENKEYSNAYGFYKYGMYVTK